MNTYRKGLALVAAACVVGAVIYFSWDWIMVGAWILSEALKGHNPFL